MTPTTIICDVCDEPVADSACFLNVSTRRAAVHVTMDVCGVACLARFAARGESNDGVDAPEEDLCA
jgi:hypothetical protein